MVLDWICLTCGEGYQYILGRNWNHCVRCGKWRFDEGYKDNRRERMKHLKQIEK